VGKSGLPATLFVGGDGKIAYVYNSVPLDDAALDKLITEHLGLVLR
jgi:hypothetical protein